MLQARGPPPKGNRVAEPSPSPYWIECSVALPGDEEGKPFRCQAKVQASDVADALDLPRWATLALLHLWKSAERRGDARARQLAHARWYLDRAVGARWQARLADTVARVLEDAVARHKGEDLASHLTELAQHLRAGEPGALRQLAESYAAELTQLKE